MSAPELPDDLAAWPSDPYRLLGVRRGTPLRAVKQAYRRLIRQYKPEHAPDAFRLIRTAFEAIERLAPVEADEDADLTDSDPDPIPASTRDDDDDDNSATPDSFTFTRDTTGAGPGLEPLAPWAPLPAEPDLWDEATADPGSAYGALVSRVERGSRREEDYLQLHWLLAICPDLDGESSPSDWLVVGFLECGPAAARLGELIRRRAEAHPDWAVGPRFQLLFTRPLPVEAARQLATWRWRSARRLGVWEAIEDDVATLRAWAPDRDVAGWAQLLLLAAENLAWAGGPARQAGRDCHDEAVALAADYALDIEDALLRAEYLDAVVAGMRQSQWRRVAGADLTALLRDGWDDRGVRFDRNLRAWAATVAANPRAALRRMTRLLRVAPGAVGLLWDFLGGPQRAAAPTPGDVRAAERFLLGRMLFSARRMRGPILAFCLRERLEPATLALALDHRRDLTFSSGVSVAQALSTDWPLMVVYRAILLDRG